MVPTGVNAYRKAQIVTASPIQLVVQLYEGAIRFTDQGIRAIEASDIAAAHRALIRAQAIVTELRATLDRDAGEVARSLEQVYDLIYRQLIAANVRKDPVPARLALSALQELAGAWSEIARGGGETVGAPVGQFAASPVGAR